MGDTGNFFGPILEIAVIHPPKAFPFQGSPEESLATQFCGTFIPFYSYPTSTRRRVCEV